MRERKKKCGIENLNKVFHVHCRFEYLNNRYVKPLLLRETGLKHRGLSITNLNRRLNEKDVRLIHNNSASSVHLQQQSTLATLLAYQNRSNTG